MAHRIQLLAMMSGNQGISELLWGHNVPMQYNTILANTYVLLHLYTNQIKKKSMWYMFDCHQVHAIFFSAQWKCSKFACTRVHIHTHARTHVKFLWRTAFSVNILIETSGSEPGGGVYGPQKGTWNLVTENVRYSSYKALHTCKHWKYIFCNTDNSNVVYLLFLLRGGILQGVPYTTTIVDVLRFPIWVLINPDWTTRSFWQ
jgi:hypothetical protein